MKFVTRCVFLAGLTAVLAGCHNHASNSTQWFPPKQDYRTAPVNCVALKRQQLYNNTNMNMDTSTTTPAQRQELDDFIAAHCE